MTLCNFNSKFLYPLQFIQARRFNTRSALMPRVLIDPLIPSPTSCLPNTFWMSATLVTLVTAACLSVSMCVYACSSGNVEMPVSISHSALNSCMRKPEKKGRGYLREDRGKSPKMDFLLFHIRLPLSVGGEWNE